MSSLKQVQKKIGSGKAYLITDSYNIAYLSGFAGSSGQILITSKQAWLLTDFRYWGMAMKTLPKEISLYKSTKSTIEDIKTICARKNIDTVFFEENNLTYAHYRTLKKNLAKIALKPQHGLIEHYRIIKTPAETAKIIKAQRIAEKVFNQIKTELQIGQSETEICWKIIELCHKYGADDVSFPPIVAFGSKSAIPHHLSGNRKLKKGDLVLIDMGAKYKGYCSDMTRTLFTATPTPKQKLVYETVLKAQEKAITAIRAGVSGSAMDAIAREHIQKSKFGKQFGHSLGHGIGLKVHEIPYLAANYSDPLPENSIVTVEPGIYLQNFFGVRIEDMVLVTRKNAINLTKIPKKIEDCIVELS